MKTRFFISIVGMALMAGACSSEFLVYKQGQGVFFGSNSKAKYELICKSGDMEKVLAATSLSSEMKDALYQYNCSDERSGDKVREIYATMTPEQRKDIRTAFQKNGYSINKGPGCCAD